MYDKSEKKYGFYEWGFDWEKRLEELEEENEILIYKLIRCGYGGTRIGIILKHEENELLKEILKSKGVLIEEIEKDIKTLKNGL